MIVKICGLTRPQDVEACAAAGVAWIGLNLWPQSKRYVTLERAAELANLAQSLGMQAVGLLVQPTPADVANVWASNAFDLLQLYQAPSDLPVGLRWIEAMAVAPQNIPNPNARRGDYALLESQVTGFGGQGQTFDWALLVGLDLSASLIGGGVTPKNVGDLLGAVRPLGVDLASGVESAPGLKDGEKIRKLMTAVNAANRP